MPLELDGLCCWTGRLCARTKRRRQSEANLARRPRAARRAPHAKLHALRAAAARPRARALPRYASRAALRQTWHAAPQRRMSSRAHLVRSATHPPLFPGPWRSNRDEQCSKVPSEALRSRRVDDAPDEPELVGVLALHVMMMTQARMTRATCRALAHHSCWHVAVQNPPSRPEPGPRAATWKLDYWRSPCSTGCYGFSF